MVGAVALVLFRAATELAIGDDGRVLPAAEFDARLPDRVDAFGELPRAGSAAFPAGLMASNEPRPTRSAVTPGDAATTTIAVFTCWPKAWVGNSVFSVTFGSMLSAADCASPSSRRMCCSALLLARPCGSAASPAATKASVERLTAPAAIGERPRSPPPTAMPSATKGLLVARPWRRRAPATPRPDSRSRSTPCPRSRWKRKCDGWAADNRAGDATRPITTHRHQQIERRMQADLSFSCST